MFKVYLENGSMILTLSEVVELTEATPAEVRKIVTRGFIRLNGFEIINLSKELV